MKSGRILALGSLLVVALGCNVVLGLPDYEDAAVQLCGCPGVSSRFSDCTERVHAVLESADAADWLATFAAEDCGACTQDFSYITCLQVPQICNAEGEACSKRYDCCGGLDGTGYCKDGTCRVEASNCLHSFAPCKNDADCCGAEGGLATCLAGDGGSICLEACLSGDQEENCPGCCTRVESAEFTAFYCIDGTAASVAFSAITAGSTVCESACIVGTNEQCPEGKVCQRVGSTDEGFIDYCL